MAGVQELEHTDEIGAISLKKEKLGLADSPKFNYTINGFANAQDLEYFLHTARISHKVTIEGISPICN